MIRAARAAQPSLHLVLILFGASIVLGCATSVSSADLAREYFNLGNAFFELGDLERSFNYYRRALDLTSELPAASYNLARIYIERGEPQSALDVLDRLQAADPQSILLLETRAYALYRSGQVEPALAQYLAVLAENPARTSARYNAAALMRRSDPKGALSVLEPAEAYDPKDRDLIWLLSEIAYEADDEQAALRFAELYQVLTENENEAQLRVASRFADWGYDLLAIEIYAGMALRGGMDPVSSFRYASALFRSTGDFDGALNALRTALRGGYSDRQAIARLVATLSEDERPVVLGVVHDAGLAPLPTIEP